MSVIKIQGYVTDTEGALSMEIIKDLIFQLDSATSDPVVKLLVISVTILIIITIISIIFSALKHFLNVLFKPFRHKKKPKRQKSSKSKQPEVSSKKDDEFTEKEPAELPIENDTNLQEAKKTLDTLNNTIQTFQNSETDFEIHHSLVSDNVKTSFTIDSVDNIEYLITPEDEEDVQKLIANKSLYELEHLLSDTQKKIMSVSATEESEKKQYAQFLNKHEELKKSEEAAIAAYNSEVSSSENTINECNQKLKKSLQNIVVLEQTISNLVEQAKKAVEDFKKAKEQLVVRVAEARPRIDELYALKTELDSNSIKLNSSLASSQQQAEQTINNYKAICSTISDLFNRIEGYKKDLSIYNLTAQKTSEAITLLKEEEAKRIAEQKARAEAEAKAKAEEKERRLEEQRKQEELRRAEEKRKREEIIKRQEEEVRRAVEERKKNTANSSDGNGESDVKATPLSPAEEAAQAKAMMEAQRKKRAEAARKKAMIENGISAEDGIEATNSVDTTPVPDIQQSPSGVVDNDLLTLAEDNQLEANVQVDEQSEVEENVYVDPMDEIRATWKREREAREALKTGDVDGALNIVNTGKKNT